MPTLVDEATAVFEAARALMTCAEALHEATARAQADLDRIEYQCRAAERHRQGMAAISHRVHQHGNALAEAGMLLLRRAASLGSLP